MGRRDPDLGYRRHVFQCTFLAHRFSKQGISEELIGKAIKKYNIPREKLVILTKCNFPLLDDPSAGRFRPEQANSRDYINKKGRPPDAPYLRAGLSRKHIFEALEASLKRLQMDYVDVLQIHRYDHDTPREETMKALHGTSQQPT